MCVRAEDKKVDHSARSCVIHWTNNQQLGRHWHWHWHWHRSMLGFVPVVSVSVYAHHTHHTHPLHHIYHTHYTHTFHTHYTYHYTIPTISP